MSGAAVVRSRASLLLRFLYGSRAASVGIPRGWFTGARLVRDVDDCVRIAASPWPTIAVRVALLVALLAAGVACGCTRAALVAVAAYALGTIDARMR